MNYKFQDILKIVIPGLYLIGGLLGVLLLSGFISLSSNSALVEFLKTPFANAFGGFIIGYILNVIASDTERYLYKKEILKRPSFHVIQKWDSEFYVCDSKVIFKALECPEVVTEENARMAFRKAKMNVQWNDILDNFYLQSILARNMLIPNGLVTIASVAVLFWRVNAMNIGVSILMIIFTIVLYQNWRRRSFLYVERVFAAVKK